MIKGGEEDEEEERGKIIMKLGNKKATQTQQTKGKKKNCATRHFKSSVIKTKNNSKKSVCECVHVCAL